MKSLIVVVFVWALAIGLIQSALMVQHRPRSQSSMEGKEFRSWSEMNRQRFVAAVQKTQWYKKGFIFVNWLLQEMRKNTDRNPYVKFYKKTNVNRWLRYELRSGKK